MRKLSPWKNESFKAACWFWGSAQSKVELSDSSLKYWNGQTPLTKLKWHCWLLHIERPYCSGHWVDRQRKIRQAVRISNDWLTAKKIQGKQCQIPRNTQFGLYFKGTLWAHLTEPKWQLIKSILIWALAIDKSRFQRQLL